MSVIESVIPVIVGVDVGGTNTDAVVLSKTDRDSTVISAVKELTSADVTSGVRNAVYAALKQATDKGYKVGVFQVNIGTTHFVNAAVQGKGLAKVSVIRLCGTTSRALPPFSDFPLDLKETVCEAVHLCDGGYRFDGREIDPVDAEEISGVIQQIKAKGIKNIVLSGIFSPVRTDQEERVHKMILDEYPEASVTLSHNIGHIGLLERENAAILNECLKPLCKKTIDGFHKALESINVTCPIYLTQNDGTIISSGDALMYPIYTFASGPTNSMRGAAFLSDVKDAIVIDIGGTTTDVGVLKNRFPREASTQVKIGRVRTNFRMPDVFSFGLGGGSYVAEKKGKDENLETVIIGPLSAGYNLKNEAIIFSSSSDDKTRKLTTSDIAVAAGLLNLGDPKRVEFLSKTLVNKALARIKQMIEEGIDQVKLSGEDLPVILVGGGSVLVDKTQKLHGASEVIIPEHSGVANAIGAALSQVSGNVDNVVSLQDMVDVKEMESAVQETLADITDPREAELAAEKVRKPYFTAARDNALQASIDKATAFAVSAGADESSIEITEKEDITLSYIPGQATRIKIKVVGDLKNWQTRCTSIKQWNPVASSNEHYESTTGALEKQTVTSTGQTLTDEHQAGDATKHPKEPYIDPQTGEWLISDWDIESIVIGAGIFGCGGGGNPHIGRLRALADVRKGKKIRVISPEKLYQTSDPVNDLVGIVAFMGAPLIMYEQLVSSNETTGAFKALQDLYAVGGYENGNLSNTDGVCVETKDGMKFIENYKASGPKAATAKKVVALMTGEIGGMNAIEPLLVGADLGVPVIDSDGMGRAFPELQMFSPYMYGIPAHPAALVDDKGTKAVALISPTPKHLENHFRERVIQMGCSAGLTLTPLNKSDIMNTTVLYSVSHVWRLGDAILKSRLAKTSPVKAILETEKSIHVLTGKINDVQRETSGGFNRGKIVIEGLDEFAGKTILVEFQNEFLVIYPYQGLQKSGHPVASVPDLITIVDADTAEPIPTEEVKYGTRVAVLVLASPEILRTEQALKTVGPKAFHYTDFEFTPIGKAHAVVPVPPTK